MNLRFIVYLTVFLSSLIAKADLSCTIKYNEGLQNFNVGDVEINQENNMARLYHRDGKYEFDFKLVKRFIDGKRYQPGVFYFSLTDVRTRRVVLSNKIGIGNENLGSSPNHELFEVEFKPPRSYKNEDGLRVTQFSIVCDPRLSQEKGGPAGL